MAPTAAALTALTSSKFILAPHHHNVYRNRGLLPVCQLLIIQKRNVSLLGRSSVTPWPVLPNQACDRYRDAVYGPGVTPFATVHWRKTVVLCKMHRDRWTPRIYRFLDDNTTQQRGNRHKLACEADFYEKHKEKDIRRYSFTVSSCPLKDVTSSPM